MPMVSVIKFPTKSARDRAMLEREIRAGLRDEGLSEKSIGIVIANMSDFIDALCLDFTFSLSTADATTISRQMKEFQSLLNCRTNTLISERVKSEVNSLVAAGFL